MKIKLLTLSLLSFSAYSASTITAEQLKIDQQNSIKMLTGLGLPLPDSGIKLVPRAMLDLPPKILEQGQRDEESIRKYGYILENTVRPMELIHFKQHALQELNQYAGNTNAASTHLRSTVKALKLGFAFKGINVAGMKNIGFVPQGSFHEEVGGWSGAVQFFDAPAIGTCAYAIRNVKVSHTAAELALEDVTYDVNSKATIKEIRGNKGSGFVYKVDWYDPENFHELECANKSYSKELNNAVITLAQTIDQNN